MSEFFDTEIGRIHKDWDYSELENYFELITYGFTNPMPDSTEGPYKITAKDIHGGKIQFSTARKTTEDAYENLITDKSRPIPNDILITKDGSIGRLAIVDNRKICISQSVAVIRPNSKIMPLYLKYLLESPKYQQIISRDATGSVMKHIYITKINKMKIGVPNLKVQESIVEVIDSIQSKIDLLHRQNQTLEQMAETLFRQWFVENPNPDWVERPLSSIATFLNGLACQKYPPKNDVDKLPVLKIKELRNGISEDCDWCSTEVDEKYIVENGDVIFSWSASLMVKIWDGKTCILNQHLFKVTTDDFPKWYYYLWSKFHLDQFIAIARAHATTMGHIKRGDLDEAMVMAPSDDEINEMNTHFDPIIEKITINNRQISKLITLRDTLLPKLMSGEIRIV